MPDYTEQDVERAKLRREGWAEAIAALRDYERFEEWFNRRWRIRPADRLQCADYLESLTPEAGQ